MAAGASYWTGVSIAAATCLGLCGAARRWPGRWTTWARWSLSALLVADAITFVVAPIVQHRWHVGTSLPLALCDVALLVAAAACAWPRAALLVELTYFWGLAGTLQAVATPDLGARFPHLEFFEYLVGHVGIVISALFLVVGLRLRPRSGAVPRVFAITVAYTVLVGSFDASTNTDYMFLRHKPVTWSLLSVLGPWPWYLAAAAGVAIVMLLALDLPFRFAAGRVGQARRMSNESIDPEDTLSYDAVDEPSARDRDGVDSLRDTEAEQGDEDEVTDQLDIDQTAAQETGADLDRLGGETPLLD
jgi:hypothetical integral membrane protein (TIGR02206 family)